MGFDKKAEAGSIRFVIPRRIGGIEPKVELPPSVVMTALASVGCRPDRADGASCATSTTCRNHKHVFDWPPIMSLDATDGGQRGHAVGRKALHASHAPRTSVMRTIAIVNQKGGCGKTTTAINLAAVIARRGRRTLLVDMDPQSHCAAGLGVPESSVTRGVGEVLLGDLDRPLDGASFLWEAPESAFGRRVR